MKCWTASLACHRKVTLPTTAPLQWLHIWDGPQEVHLSVSQGRDGANPPSEMTLAFVPGPAGHTTLLKNTAWLHLSLFLQDSTELESNSTNTTKNNGCVMSHNGLRALRCVIEQWNLNQFGFSFIK